MFNCVGPSAGTVMSGKGAMIFPMIEKKHFELVLALCRTCNKPRELEKLMTK